MKSWEMFGGDGPQTGVQQTEGQAASPLSAPQAQGVKPQEQTPQDRHGHADSRPVPGKRARPGWVKPLVIGLAMLAVAGAGFAGGVKYGESREPGAAETAVTDPSLRSGPGMQDGTMGGGAMGMMGEVAAVNSSSITVENTRSGSRSTYAITGSTEISDEGEDAEVSDIEVGDEVLVIPSSSDEDAAAQIMINPVIGGPGQDMPMPPGE